MVKGNFFSYLRKPCREQEILETMHFETLYHICSNCNHEYSDDEHLTTMAAIASIKQLSHAVRTSTVLSVVL